MKKRFLSFIILLSAFMTLTGCSNLDKEDSTVYVGTISYVMKEKVSSGLVLSPIFSFFQEKLDGVADVTNTDGSFVISCKNGKQDAVKQILTEVNEELQQVMDELEIYVRSCVVKVYEHSNVIFEFIFTSKEESVGGHDNTQGTVPGFDWQ